MLRWLWLCFFLFAVVPARAEEAGDKSALEAELEQLRAQVKALEAKLEKVLQERERAGEKSASLEPKAEAEVKPIPGRGLTDRGLYYGLAAGPAGQRYGRSIFGDLVRIGGYGSFRFEANNIDKGPAIGALPPVRLGFDSFDFRRFVLTTDITPFDRLRVYTEIEYERLNEIEVERTAIPENRGRRERAGTRFIQEVEGQSGGEIAMEQAWAQFDFTDWLGLRFGVILPPLGRFNILHDDDYWDIPRRPLVDRGGPVLPVKSAWREMGAGLLGTKQWGRGYIDYQFYVMNGVTLDFNNELVTSLRSGRTLLEIEPEIEFASGAFNGTNPADAVSWRLAVSPKIGNEIAISGYHGQYTPDFLKTNASINAFGIDGKLTLGRFEVEGEFIYSDFGKMQRVLEDLAAQLVNSAAATSSTETRALEAEIEAELAGPFTNQRYGFWVDFKYRFWPRWLDRSFLGQGFENAQLIPIVRYERIWFNDFFTDVRFSNGLLQGVSRENVSQDRITVGMTYRPTTSVAFTTAFEHNHLREGSRLIFPSVLGLGRIPDRSFDTLIFGVAFGF